MWRRVNVRAEQAESADIDAALSELGALSITYADAGDAPILEPAPGATPLWSTVRISGLFPENISETMITQSLASTNSREVTFETIADRDWVTDFNESLKPMQFAERLWICPQGCNCPDPAATSITMDPGLAFGTGGHPTTALCLDWLARVSLRNLSLLDYGCGSGVLSIAAIALGANAATAIDIDPQALAATRLMPSTMPYKNAYQQ